MFCFSSPFGRREGGGGGLSEGPSGVRVEEDGVLEDVEAENVQDSVKTVVQLQVSESQRNEIPSKNIFFNNRNINNNNVAGNSDLPSVRPVQRLNLTNWNNEGLSGGNKKCLREDLLGSFGDNVASPLGSAGSSVGEVSEGMGDEEDEEEEEEDEEDYDDDDGREEGRSRRRRRRRRRRREEVDEAHESLESGCSRGGVGSGTSPSGSSSGPVGAEGVGSGSSDSLLSPACSAIPTSTASLTPRSGPRFKLLAEGDVQVCVVQHCRGLVGKVLASKFLRRWEMHHLYLNDTCISSRTPTGFMESSVPYCSMEEVHSVARWDASHRFCVRIIIPTGSILLQANNSYTRDQWYHSIVWKKNIYKHRNILRNSTRPEVILREVKSLVSLATNTPLQDECVAHVPLQIVSSLLAEEHPPWSSYQINSPSDDESFCGEETVDDEVEEEMVWAIGPLLEDRPPPPELCRFFSRRCLLRPRSSLVPRIFTPVVHRILKHNVDFGKHPHMRRFVQDYIRALHSHNGGCDVVRGFVSSVHGQTSGCPHPRVLPNLVSVCLGAIFSHFEARCKRLQRVRRQRQLRTGPSRSETDGDEVDPSSGSGTRKPFKLRMSTHRESLRRGNAAAWGLEDGEGGWRKGRATDVTRSKGDTSSSSEQRRGKGGESVKNSSTCIPAIVCIHNQKAREEDDDDVDGDEATVMKAQVVNRDGTSVRGIEVRGAPLAQQEEDVYDDEENGEGDRLLKEAGPDGKEAEGDAEIKKVEMPPEEEAVAGVEISEELEERKDKDEGRISKEDADRVWKEEENIKRQEEEEESQLRCYLTVFLAISEYDDWRPGLAQLLQPIPFPDDALAHEPFLSGLVPVVRRIGTDPRCEVHQMVLGVREGKEGLFSLYCPTSTSSSSPPPYFSPSPMPSPTFPFPSTSPLCLFPPSFQHQLCPSAVPGSAPPFPTSCPSSPYSGPPFSAPPYSRTFRLENSCYDDGSLWCEILGTLLNCCCRRKNFVAMLASRHLGACMLLALRDQSQAQDALCLMLEWNLLGGSSGEVGKRTKKKEVSDGKTVGVEVKRVVRRKRTVRRRIRVGDSIPIMNLDDGRLNTKKLSTGSDKMTESIGGDATESTTVTTVTENESAAIIPGLEGDLIKFQENERNIHHDNTSDITFDSVVSPKLDVLSSECSASGEIEGNKSDLGNELKGQDKLPMVKPCKLVSKDLLGIFDPIKNNKNDPISVCLPKHTEENSVTLNNSTQMVKEGVGNAELDLTKGSVKVCDDRLGQVAQGGEGEQLADREVIVEVDDEEDDDEDDDDEDEEDEDDEEEEEDQRTLQVVTTLQSTETGRAKYATLCQKQMHLRELHLLQQQKGGPRKLSLPPRSTDADVCRLVMGVGSDEDIQDGEKDGFSHTLPRIPPYARFGSLECLSLAFTHVTSSCAAHLIHIPSLRYLNLWSTQFGDAGLQLICEHLHRLQVLNLCETPVTDKGILCITALKNLRRLNLNSTRLSPETFEKLKAALPSLQECDVRYTDAW